MSVRTDSGLSGLISTTKTDGKGIANSEVFTMAGVGNSMETNVVTATLHPRLGLIVGREVGKLAYPWQWARESRYVQRARERHELSPKTFYQLQAICRQGFQLAQRAQDIAAAQEERSDQNGAVEPPLSRLERIDGWVDALARRYRRIWLGKLAPGAAMLDCLGIASAAMVNLELQYQYEARQMERERQLLQAPAALEHDEQPAADAEYNDEAFDVSAPTIRVGRPIRVTRE